MLATAPPELLGVTEDTHVPPKTRLRDAEAARSLVQAVINEDNAGWNSRSTKRALVKGMVDGHKPYNAAKQKEAGLAWCANLNFLEGEALMDSSAVPYYALFNGVEYYAETRTGYQPNHPDHEQWHGFIACRFHNMLKRWPQFDWHIQQTSYWMRMHGPGPCFFDRDGDWRFRSLPSSAVLAPKKAASCVDERLKFLVVRTEYTVVELWDRIRNKDAAKAVGWDVETVKKTIAKASRENPGRGQTWENWEQIEQKLNNNDICASYTDFGDVPAAHLLVQEFSGKISHFIVTETPMLDTENVANNESDPNKKFLYRKLSAYDSMDQALIVFFQNSGDGTWHSVRGLATKAYPHIVVSNRLKCRMIDGAFIESSLVLKPGSTKSSDKLKLMQIGPVTVVPPGCEVQQGKLSGFLDGPIAVDRILSNHLAHNVGMFNQRTISRDDGRGETVTAAEVQAQVAKESSLSQGQMTLFYLTLDKLYAEIFRRASDPNTSDEEAKRFQRECQKDGVPAKALQEMEFVRANRASGYGSPQMRQLTDQQMMPLVPMLPEQGRQNFLEDAVGGIKGADKVRRYVPREHIPDSDDSVAAMENAMISIGRLPVIVSGQNPVIHLHSHLADAAEVLEPVRMMFESGQKDSAALEQAYRYTQLMSQHVEGHLGGMRSDLTRKGLVRMFEEQLAHLTGFNTKLRGAVISARRAAKLEADKAAQATNIDALTQAKVRAVDAQIINDTRKTEATIASKRMKTLNDSRMKQIQTAEEVRMGRVKEATNGSNGNGNGSHGATATAHSTGEPAEPDTIVVKIPKHKPPEPPAPPPAKPTKKSGSLKKVADGHYSFEVTEE